MLRAGEEEDSEEMVKQDIFTIVILFYYYYYRLRAVHSLFLSCKCVCATSFVCV